MHAYPAQLADFVLDQWPARTPLGLERRALVELLSSSFQASLAHEEGRAVRFRLVASAPSAVRSTVGDENFAPLVFTEALALTPETLRRLSPAAPFHSSVVGAAFAEGGWSLWGLVHTGADWLAPSWGGRDHHRALELPQVHVLGPGRLAVYAGAELVASLERGMIEATTTDVFTSQWLRELFRANRRSFAQSAEELSLADDELVRVISQHMVRRAMFLIRQAGNGGLILFADEGLAQGENTPGPLKLKYTFAPGEARERYRRLLRRLVQTLAKQGGERPIDLEHFSRMATPEVLEVEQAIFDVSSLIAGLADVDGAVVIDKRMQLIGFGAEVSGELPYPDTVWQALDVEAEKRVPEAANSVGTRHRAAYRFVSAHPTGLAIVISHDGIVRFVSNLGGDVVFWDQFLNW